MRVKALYPLYPPFFASGFLVAEFDNLISYLRTKRELRVVGSEFHDDETLFVSVREFSRSLKKRYFPNKIYIEKGGYLIQFEGQFEFPGVYSFFLTNKDGKRGEHTESELRSIWISVLPSILALSIHTYLFSLVIAFSGAARVAGNVWLVDRKVHYHKDHYVSTVGDGVEYLVENGFCPNFTLNPERVHKWVRSQNGILNGFSDTPASRALNYFSRLFVRSFRNDELSDLIWALAGIEALLVDGGRSSLGQLREKIDALFPQHSHAGWLRSMTEKMYGYRSRMVHGDRQIRSAFRSDEAESDGRFREEYDSARFAIGLLLVLLQEVIKRDVASLQFKTVYVGNT